jgi:hypothetical protein
MELGGSLGAFGGFMDVGGVLKGPSGGHWRSLRRSLGVFGGSFSPRGSSGRARECPKTRQVFPERLGGSWTAFGVVLVGSDLGGGICTLAWRPQMARRRTLQRQTVRVQLGTQM